MGIGSRVRTLRRATGLTQEELARRAGVNLNVVGLLERGDTRDPHVSNLQSIAHALGVPVGELLEEPAHAGKDRAPEEAGPAEAGDEERIIDMAPAAFHRRLSEAPSNEDLLDLYRQIDAEYIDAELTYRADEDNRTAYRDYAHAIERHMMVVLSLNIRGVTPPDPEQLLLQAGKLEKLRK